MLIDYTFLPHHYTRNWPMNMVLWSMFSDLLPLWRLKKMLKVSVLGFNSLRCASKHWLSAFLKESGCRADSSKLPHLDVTDFCRINSGLKISTDIKILRGVNQGEGAGLAVGPPRVIRCSKNGRIAGRCVGPPTCMNRLQIHVLRQPWKNVS